MMNYEVKVRGNLKVSVGDVSDITVMDGFSCTISDTIDGKLYDINGRDCTEMIIPRESFIDNMTFKLSGVDCISFSAEDVRNAVVGKLSVVTQDGIVEFHGEAFFLDLDVETRNGNGTCDIRVKRDCKIYYRSLNGFWSSIISGAKNITHSLGGSFVRNNMPVWHKFGAKGNVNLLVSTNGGVVCS